MTMAGLAIGLGNVWRFPYMMGQYGGSAFLIIYLVFMLMLAVPALTAEWALGRATRSGPVQAYQAAFGTGTGLVVGLVLGFSAFMALTYYNIIVANVVYSAWFAAQHGFNDQTLDAYQAGLSQAGTQFGLALGVMTVSFWIVHRGLRRGIEVVNRTLVPAFGVIAVYLTSRALSITCATSCSLTFPAPESMCGSPPWGRPVSRSVFQVCWR
jgi:NSS family neurotransmitter:Na+ symporter